MPEQKLENNIIRQLNAYTSMTEIIQKLCSGNNEKEIINTILSKISEEFNIENNYIVLYNMREPIENHIINYQYTKNNTPLNNEKIKNDKNIFKWVINNKEALILQKKFDSENKFLDSKTSVKICLPLKIKEKIIAFFNCEILENNRYLTIEEIEFIKVFSNYCALTINNKKLETETKMQINELHYLNKVGYAVNSTLQKEEVIKLIFDFMQELIDFHIGAILLINKEQKEAEINLITAQQVDNELIEQIKNYMNKRLKDIYEQDFKFKEIKFNLEKDDVFFADLPTLKGKVESILDVPLTIRGETIGLIAVMTMYTNWMGKNYERTLKTFASQVSIAIENSEIYQKMQKKVFELSLLFEVTKTMSSKLDTDEILNFLASVIVEMFDIKWNCIRILDPITGQLTFKSGICSSEQTINKCNNTLCKHLLNKVIERKKPLYIENIADNPVYSCKEISDTGIVSLFSVPIMFDDEIKGIITIHSENKYNFNNDERNLLINLATQAAISIKNAKLYENMHKNYLDTIKALSAAIDTKDHYTRGHSEKVMDYSTSIAIYLGLSKNEIRKIKLAGLLHDIGKIGIDEMILLKNKRLTEEEFKKIKAHPEMGALILNRVDFLHDIVPLTLYHHEKFNGTGYPRGLKGEEIPIGARILSVADTFDAMTSTRSYRKALTVEEAIQELIKGKNTQFDPQIVDAFLEVLQND